MEGEEIGDARIYMLGITPYNKYTSGMGRKYINHGQIRISLKTKPKEINDNNKN